jgi:ParB family chromosome partitioning protein
MHAAEPKRNKRPASKLEDAIRKNVSVLDRDHAATVDQSTQTLELQEVRAQSQRDPNARLVSMAAIRPDPNQVRRTLDTESDEFQELVADLKENGLINPIMLRWVEGEQLFEIVAGHRRYHAAKVLEWKVIAAQVRDLSDEAKTIVQLTENIHRQNLHPLEEARALRQIMADQHLTQDQVAKQVAKNRVYVTEALTMLDKLTPEEIAYLDECRPANIPGRSVILMAARTEDPDTRRAILHGEIRRQEARERAKPSNPDGRTKYTTHRYELPELQAKVTVTIQKAGATDQEMRVALEAALKEQSKRGGKGGGLRRLVGKG